MKFRRNRNVEGTQVETVDMNKTMNEKPKNGFGFSFGIGYSINGRHEDIFGTEI